MLAGSAFLSYRRPLVPLTPVQRAVLIGLRALSLVAVLLFACRPVILLPPANAGDVVVPVLVDTSRSMAIADLDGRTRLEAARTALTSTVLPRLARTGKVEVFGVGEGLAETPIDALAADGRRTDLAAAVSAVRERYRGRRVGGVLLLSDGGDTTQAAERAVVRAGAPVFAVGVGSVEGLPDREVIGITAGDPRLDQALVDLHVVTDTHGLGREPYVLRLLANGQLVDTRRVTPVADGSPTDETFAVTPDPLNATVYTAEVVVDARERIAENNVRSVLLSPAARKRRLLVLGGSPGYEHSFLVRALTQDPSVEVDSIVRKGKDDSGRDTFLIQAGGGRGAGLVSGFPTTRESLFAYDAVVIGNLEGDFFGRAQMELLADFVSVRGGGLLLLGSRTFLQRGLAGSVLEEALPVELNDRRGGAPARAVDGDPIAQNAVRVTDEGARHPIMRIAATPEESRERWAALPPLASSAPVGGPRPGATVLAITQSANGAPVPLVAIQRYGRGRSMVFSGEASWRWRMLRPSDDRSYEFFWRQAARWLAGDAPEPVTLTLPDSPVPGEPVPVQLESRNAGFDLVADAAVEATLTAPGGEQQPLTLRPAGTGRHAATLSPEVPGLYRIHAESRLGATLLGVADRWFYVGGTDPEYADPRLNQGYLRRLARQTAGQYASLDEVDRLLDALTSAAPQTLEPERRDLWHQPWAFLLVMGLLAAEWILRRTWGMR
ncbi:MAG: CARDB domain-containing protein [Vicinamibacterales bacterium]